ncbi:chitinase-like protein EN03 isoform X2 [Pectinophora gossypiella]|uniref:chitinase-like protein EN03 isoform X2 n=1 Tax=Pectinophora gossypiella TaxID=13191 RepID=UPI00214EC73F|nr:chitinase-like protein EN03 isoform X2 [Pectinophora gossypiella]
MKFLLAFVGVLAVVAGNTTPTGKVVCYYDSKSFVRESNARMLPLDLEPALSFCTHLVYGYAGVQPDTYKMVPLNENLDVDRSHANYRTITNFKSKYPALKVLLSVGGDADTEEVQKYNLLLESPQARTAFVNSGVLLAEQHGFDGIDLAWQFAKYKPKKIRSTWGSIWHGIKKTFGTTPVDDKESEHREGFTALVRELKQALSVKSNMQLAITVLPNVNSSIYYDVPAIINLVDLVNIDAFDYYTSERNPKEADYAAPIYTPQNRNPLQNADAAVNYWLQGGAPANKIILGISALARTWKMDSESEISGVPPIHVDGPGEAGPYTKIEGVLSYPEVCAKLINPNHQKGMRPHLRKVTDPSKRFEKPLTKDEDLSHIFGTYAFRLPDDSGEPGLWVSYEDPDTAGQKAAYVKSKNLGGISIVDLSMDDFRGLCTGDKYPILRAAKYRL